MNNLLIKSDIELINGQLKDDLNFIINTKNIKKNSIFIPLKGKRDGHDFILKAVQKGALGFFVDNNHLSIVNKALKFNKRLIIFKTKDNLKAMVDLARNIRNSLDIPVIGITGSYSKTTTKEMLKSILKQKYKVLSTMENMNNIIGLSLTLLNYHKEDIILLELGSNHNGEIKRLTDIAKPTITIITHIGSSHIGNFRSKRNILKEKKDINKYSKIYFRNVDDKYLKKVKSKNNIIDYSLKDLNRLILKNKISYLYEDDLYIINSDLDYLVLPSLIGIKLGKILGISVKDIKKGIYKFKNVKMRMEKIKKGKYLIINDSYNASLETMLSGIDYFGNLKVNNKLLVLGDILEIGNKKKKIYKIIGKHLKKNNYDFSEIFLVGKDINYLYKYLSKYHVRYFDNVNDINYKDLINKNIYLKGSNKINLWKLTKI